MINAKKTGMGDVPTAAIATSVEYGIIFSGNKSTLMRLIGRDTRCEQHKIRYSHDFFSYFDGELQLGIPTRGLSSSNRAATNLRAWG